MPEALSLADARSAKLSFPTGGAVELIGRSNAITRVHDLIRRAAASDGGTLITGEAGSAVEPVARELHGRSRQSTASFVMVECAALPAAGIGRVLFGLLPDPSTRSGSPLASAK